jgi:flavorubredoxin
MNEWLKVAPSAQIAHSAIGCMVQLNDLADRAPRPLTDGEVIDLGGKRVRHIYTPHVPHAWDAGIMFEETTGTLLCGDLFTHVGNGPAVTTDDIIVPSVEAEAIFRSTSLAPNTAVTISALADLAPRTLAVMHGSSYAGDGAKALLDLAAAYDERYLAAA